MEGRVIDTFLFGGELDILEIRLRYLGDVVDNFIIVESNHSFSGKPKPYHLEDNWERYSQWHDRILYLQIEQDPSEYVFNKVDTYTPTDGAFKMEYDCRNALMHANHLIKDEDIVLLSDVDEIWDKSMLFDVDIRNYINSTRSALSAAQHFYAYYLNNLTAEGPDYIWKGSIMCTGQYWKNTTPQWIRDNRNNYKAILNGWHFSWMNGLEAIKTKIQNFAHTEFNRPEILDDQAILKAIEEGRDVLQRPGVSYELKGLDIFPDDLRNILQDYPHLIKQ